MIQFYPKAGMVLMCDFDGYRVPEIVKNRPVVVVSPTRLTRHGLTTVVPLSTTAPSPVQPYHYILEGNPIPGNARLAWAKCDLVATVRYERLDRIRVDRGTYQVGRVSMDQVRAIRNCVAISIGIDLDGAKS